jgi:hypothetical protein
MRTLRSFVLLVLVWLVAPMAAHAGPADPVVQSVPDTLNVQGVLRNLDGEAVTGTYVLTFRFLPSSGGSPFLTLASPSLFVTNGLFNVNLELGTDHNYFREQGGDIWLQLGVSAGGGPVDWLPARPIGSVGYAFMAENARVCETLVNPAPDLACTNPLGCVSPGELTSDFKWAMGTTAGGPAADLDCTAMPAGCVSRAEIVDSAINSDKILDGSVDSIDLHGSLALTGDTSVMNLVVKGTGGGGGGLYTDAAGLIAPTTLRLTPQGALQNITTLSLSGQITSTVAGDRTGTGNAPFVVASSKRVDNLNANYLDGQNGAYYTNASNIISGTVNQAYLPKADGTTMGISKAGTGLSATAGTMNNTGVLTVTASQTGNPLASSGGQNPNITIAQATASQSGYLDMNDWTTFNNKIKSVTGTSPIGVSTDAQKNVTVSIQQATGLQNGYLSMGDWTTFNSKAEKTGEAGYVQNQAATTQTATFKISGDGTLNKVIASSFEDKDGATWIVDPSTNQVSATLNGQVGIGTASPTAGVKLDIVGGSATWSVQADKKIKVTADPPFDLSALPATPNMITKLNADMLDGQHASEFAASSGSGNYIQNQNASAQTANMWISGSATAGGDVTANRVCLGGVCNNNWSNAGPWAVVTGPTGSGIKNTNASSNFQVGIGPGTGSGLTDVKGVLDVNNNTWFQTNGSMVLQGSRNSPQGIEWYTAKDDRYGIANAAAGNLALYTAGASAGSAITFNVARDAGSYTLTEMARIGRIGLTGIVPYLGLGDSGGPLTAPEAQISVGNAGAGDPAWTFGAKGALFRGADTGAFFGIVDGTTPGIVFGESGASKNFGIYSYDNAGTKTVRATMLPSGELGVGKVPAASGGYVQVPGTAGNVAIDGGQGDFVAKRFCFPGGGACATDWAEYTKWLSNGNNLYTYATNLNVGIDTGSSPGYPLTIGVSNNAATPPGVFAVENTASFVAKNSAGTYKEYLTARNATDQTNLTYGTGGLFVKNEAGTNALRIDNAGQVGIGLGATAPAYPLHAKGIARIEGAGTGSGILDVMKGGGTAATRLQSSAADGSRLWIGASGGTPTVMDTVFSTQGSYSTGASLQYTPGTVGAAGGLLDIGQLQRSGSDTWTHGFTRFYTGAATDTTPQLRMMIDNGGDVGIGSGFTTTATGAPQFPLSVIRSGKPQLSIGSSQDTGTGLVAGQLNLWGGGTAPTNGVADIAANGWWNGTSWQYGGTGFADRIGMASGNISFYTAPSGAGALTWTEVMKIGQNGNVGIGNPPATGTYKLDVTGTGRFTDFLSLTSDGTTPKDPTQTYHAATKNYVDTRVGTPVGAGTLDGQTLRYSTAQSKWIASSNVFNADGNVGIGSPSTVGAKLTVNGDMAVNDTAMTQPAGWTAGAMKLQVSGPTGVTTGWNGAANFGDATNGHVVAGVYNQYPAVQGYTASFGAGRNLFLNPAGGNVGVGGATAGKTLDVTGTGHFSQALTLDLAPSAGTDATNKTYVDGAVDGRVGTGAINNTLRHDGAKWVANSNLTALADGRVGIKMSPTATLDVAGTIGATDNIVSAKKVVGTTLNPTGPGTWPNIWDAPSFHAIDVAGGPTNQDNFATITFASTNRPSEPGALIHNSHPTNRSRFIFSPGGTPDMMDYVGVQNVGGTPGGAPLAIPAYDSEKIRLYANGLGYFGGNVTIAGTPAANTDAATVGYLKANTIYLGDVGTPSSGDTLRYDGSKWVRNNVLFNNGTAVAIGATAPVTPGAKLDVRGDVLAQGVNAANGYNFVAKGTSAANDWYLGINAAGNKPFELIKGGAPGSGNAALSMDPVTNTLTVRNNINAIGDLGGQQISATTFCLDGVCKGTWGELTDAYWGGSGKVVYTAGAGKSPVENDWQVGINKLTPDAGYSLDVNGKLKADNVRHYYVVRDLGAAQGAYAEVGVFAVARGAANLDVRVTMSETGMSISKQYMVPLASGIGNGATDYINVLPISSSGAYGGDFELQLRNAPGAEESHYLRIQRLVAGGTTGKVVVHIAERGLNGTQGLPFNTTFNEMTGTGTVAVATGMLESTVLTQVDGKVGLGTRAPGYLLDVAGNSRHNGTTYIGADTNLALSRGSGDALRIQTGTGWVDVGSQNSGWVHLQSDGKPFYFNNRVSVNGNMEPYANEATNLGASGMRWNAAYIKTLYLGSSQTDIDTLYLKGQSGGSDQNYLPKWAANNSKNLVTSTIRDNGTNVYTTLPFASDGTGTFGTGSSPDGASLILRANNISGIDFQDNGAPTGTLRYTNTMFTLAPNLTVSGNVNAGGNVVATGNVSGVNVTASGQLAGNTISVANGGTISGTTYMGTIGSSGSRATKIWTTDLDVSGTIQGGNFTGGTGTFSGTVSAPNITLGGVNRSTWPTDISVAAHSTNQHVKFTGTGNTIGPAVISDDGTNASMSGTFTAGALTATGAVTGGSVTSTGKMYAGSTGVDYPANGGDWNFTLTLNGADSTSIGFHDSGANVGKIRFQNNNFYIGENAGWGTANVSIPGALSVGGGISGASISAGSGVIGGVTLASNGGSFSGTLTGGTFVGTHRGPGTMWACQTNGAFNGGGPDGEVRGIKYEVEKNSGYPAGNGWGDTPWQNLPGMTKSITCDRAADIYVVATGTVNGTTGACDLAQYILFNGGDSTMGYSHAYAASGQRQQFALTGQSSCSAGQAVTVAVWSYNWAGATGCSVCSEGYGDGTWSRCNMTIKLVYK